MIKQKLNKDLQGNQKKDQWKLHRQKKTQRPENMKLMRQRSAGERKIWRSRRGESGKATRTQ